VYGGFKGIVDGLADACADLDAPVVGGNVSLYNDSVEGPIPPTPTLALIGTRKGYNAPPAALDADSAGDSELLLIGAGGADGGALGGSEYLAQAGEQTGSRRCRTRRPRVLPTASRRSQRSPATNRRSRPTT